MTPEERERITVLVAEAQMGRLQEGPLQNLKLWHTIVDQVIAPLLAEAWEQGWEDGAADSAAVGNSYPQSVMAKEPNPYRLGGPS